MSFIIFIKVPWHFTKITFFFLICFYFSIDYFQRIFFVWNHRGDRSLSVFALDVSKQLLGLLTLQLLGTSEALSQLLAEAKVGLNPGGSGQNAGKSPEKWWKMEGYSWENMGQPSVNEGSARLGRSSKWRISQACDWLPTLWTWKNSSEISSFLMADVGPKWTAELPCDIRWYPVDFAGDGGSWLWVFALAKLQSADLWTDRAEQGLEWEECEKQLCQLGATGFRVWVISRYWPPKAGLANEVTPLLFRSFPEGPFAGVGAFLEYFVLCFH